MNRRHFVIGGAAATGAGAALLAEGCAGMNSLGPLNPLGGKYTLNVRYATTNFGSRTLHTRTYNGSTAGPTLEAFPGDILRIIVNNQLPPNPPAPIPTPPFMTRSYAGMNALMQRKPTGKTMAMAPIDPMNNPHSFNTTNLHVHGIQTVPHLYEPIGTTNASAMMIAIEPGQQYQYDFPIPADHPSGLFWYHPHHHGSTDVQVSGGMAGLIVIRGPIDQVPEIKAARDIHMAVQTLNVNKSADGKTYEWEPVAYSSGTNGYANGTNYAMYTVMGQGVLWVDGVAGTATQLTAPEIPMQPGEVIRLRLLNGTNGTYLPLVLSGMPDIASYIIATDGVNFGKPLKATLDLPKSQLLTQANLLDTSRFLSTAPGNRVELLIQAPATPGTFTLSSVNQSGIESALQSFDLATFVVSGTPVTMGIPTSLPIPTREYPAIADSEIVNRRTIQFHEGTTGPPGSGTVLGGFYTWVDNALFDEMKINQHLTLGSAEEWTLINATSCGHPFHIHVNSFQVTEVNGKPAPFQIYDTFMVPPAQGTGGANQFDNLPGPGIVKIRMRFKQWTGKAVFHCHILPHEDAGMMNNILIT